MISVLRRERERKAALRDSLVTQPNSEPEASERQKVKVTGT